MWPNKGHIILDVRYLLINTIDFIEPVFVPVLENYTVISSTSAVILIEDFMPVLWRGYSKYFYITATPIDYAETNIKTSIKTIKFTFELENYAVRSEKCDEEIIARYMFQFFNKTMKIEVNNLHHYTNYSMKFKACNGKGCGTSSEEIIFKTDEYVPTCSPSNIVLQNTSSTSLVVTWSKLTTECSHGIIRGYNMTLRRTRTGELIKKSVDTAMAAVYENLYEYEFACIRIGGYTSKGLGNVSGEVCAHTAEDGK